MDSSVVEKVLIRKTAYDYGMIKFHIDEMLSSLDNQRIARGSRIIIKPNLLMPAPPEKGILTHPMIVRAVAEYLLERGVKVQISDSPAVGTFHKVLTRGGFFDALKGLDVQFQEFTESVKVDTGEPFGTIEISKDAVEADGIINLAKLKSHSQMLLTLGVKNLFGCIVGLRKPEWHLRAGVDKEMFARLIVRIYETIRPIYTIVDGITALEGEGPGKAGTPREMNVLLGGQNAHAVDKAVCLLLGLNPKELFTYNQAIQQWVFDGKVHIEGDMKIVYDFRFPILTQLTFGPKYLERFMRRYVIERPVVNNKQCKLCGECWNYCPAKVITYSVKGIKIRYEDCIRCYCCVEICPHGALKSCQPVVGKILHRWMR